MNNMRILHISTADYGGAGKAALRLHAALKSSGVNSRMLVLYRKSSDSDVVSFGRRDIIFRRIFRKIRNKAYILEAKFRQKGRSKESEMFSSDKTAYRISRHPIVKESDIIHLHWIGQMVDYAEFFANTADKKIVWTMHDMNPFTGGCHYAGDCIRYRTMCCSCPQLGSAGLNDMSSKIWLRKKNSYEGRQIRAVSPSRWLAVCAMNSQLFKTFKIDVIPNGLPVSVFTRHEKPYARKLLGLPLDKTLLLFAAQEATAIRKGIHYLKTALNLIKNKNNNSGISLITFGADLTGLLKDVRLPVYHMGFIKDEFRLSFCYSAADVFIMPSLEDNFPSTVLESMACGVPVVGFNAGGVPEVLRHGDTGLLARARSAEELCGCIDWMIKHPQERRLMGLNAQRNVEQKYTVEIQAEHYRKIYNSIYKAN